MELLILCGCDQVVPSRKMTENFFWSKVNEVTTDLKTKKKNEENSTLAPNGEEAELEDTGGRREAILETIIEVTGEEDESTYNQDGNLNGSTEENENFAREADDFGDNRDGDGMEEADKMSEVDQLEARNDEDTTRNEQELRRSETPRHSQREQSTVAEKRKEKPKVGQNVQKYKFNPDWRELANSFMGL